MDLLTNKFFESNYVQTKPFLQFIIITNPSLKSINKEINQKPLVIFFENNISYLQEIRSDGFHEIGLIEDEERLGLRKLDELFSKEVLGLPMDPQGAMGFSTPPEHAQQVVHRQQLHDDVFTS